MPFERPLERTTVFLPCHTLDDFPTWLEEAEAEDLLSAWTAAWHPAVVAAVGAAPVWASIDLPVPQGPLLGIVPSTWDDRFAAQFDAACTVGSVFVRRTVGVQAIERVAADRLGLADGPLAGAGWVDDFRALGIAVLVAELLARRMRTHADLESTGFVAAVVAAAQAAVTGHDEDARESLREAFDAISASRARYYPVDSYAIDLVLVAASARGPALEAAIESPVPVAVAAAGDSIARVAASHPAAIAAIRTAVDAGRVELCGGLADDAPLDLATPESVLASFARGREVCRTLLGSPPASFARAAGGAVSLLPQLVAGLGMEGGLWTLFDGSPLPDVGGGMIRWQGGGAAVDLLAAAPLDARSARTVLSLSETLGDALDREHVAALLFAHYAGTASRWHALVRRIGQWTNLLGTFVTPRELARRAGSAGTPVSLEPDAFPPSMPRSVAAGDDDPIAAAVARAAEEARAVVVGTNSLTVSMPPPPRPAAAAQPPRRRWLSFAVPTAATRDPDRLVLDNGMVRVEAHPQTGGLLSLRRDRDGANRLSQQLAVRITRPAGAAGSTWETADDRVSFTRMVADAVERVSDADGRDAILSRGRLIAGDGSEVARFSQAFSLIPALPLASIDIDLQFERPFVGPLLDNHAAARFAWHENEHVEIRRSLLTQSVTTERTRFTAPHFIEIVPEGSRFDAADDAVAILTGGLPWHLLSTPHVLDSLLAGGTATRVSRRIGLGLGLRRPWDAALRLTAVAPLHGAVPGLPDNVRLTVSEQVAGAGPPTGGRFGVLESAGRAGDVSIDWQRPVVKATAVDFTGAPRPEPAVAIDGTRTVVSLERYQWLQLDVEFAG
ncbi:MAG: hypothetical protein KJS77_06120 [Planctomycetes bacterium]|nr:hypothetical protein [Planctomycetota bacterium]